MSEVRAPFAAVVLAGGRSTRMGMEKALLADRTGRTMLARQLALLEKLRPAELLLSARHEQVLPKTDVSVRRLDDDGRAGPLGGIVAALQNISCDRLLAIAVDLPLLDESVLQFLLRANGGVVPQVNGRLEPLVAVYPRRWLPEAVDALAQGTWSLQRLLTTAIRAGTFSMLQFSDPRPFLNWNRPHDYPP